ncbi:MAG: sugar phosphate nucleotidyltransferase [Ginsengibacter sp.]
MKAMLLAAGLGTRLKPFTDSHPKALAVVNGKTILQRNIEYLSGFGINEFIINIHHFPTQIADFLKANNNFGKTIVISDESEEVLETGGGLMKASWFFKDDPRPFILMNVDVLTDMNLEAMIKQHMKLQPLATLAVTNRYTSRYFLFDDVDQLCGWKNIKTGEQKIIREATKFYPKAFSGIHIISPKIFSLIKMNGKFSIRDIYLELASTNTITEFDHSNSKFVDVGKPGSILKAESIFS